MNTSYVIFIIILIVLILIGIGIWYFYFRSTTNNTDPPLPGNTIPPPPGNTGPPAPNNFVKYGDTIKLFGFFNSGTNGNYLSPCGGIQGCSTTGSLRSDDSYVNNNGDSNKLRLWQIRTGTDNPAGTPIKYEDTIILISLATGTPNLTGNPLSLCHDPNFPDTTMVNNTHRPSTHLWTIKKDPSNTDPSNTISYNGKLIFINNGSKDGNGYLQNFNEPDSSGSGCGRLVGAGSLDVNDVNTIIWRIEKG